MVGWDGEMEHPRWMEGWRDGREGSPKWIVGWREGREAPLQTTRPKWERRDGSPNLMVGKNHWDHGMEGWNTPAGWRDGRMVGWWGGKPQVDGRLEVREGSPASDK